MVGPTEGRTRAFAGLEATELRARRGSRRRGERPVAEPRPDRRDSWTWRPPSSWRRSSWNGPRRVARRPDVGLERPSRSSSLGSGLSGASNELGSSALWGSRTSESVPTPTSSWKVCPRMPGGRPGATCRGAPRARAPHDRRRRPGGHPEACSQASRTPRPCRSSPTRRGDGPAMHSFGRTWYRSGDGKPAL
jgi:hypothetical protein